MDMPSLDGVCVCAGNGYLCSVSPSLYAQHYEQHLPDSITGADFLKQYHNHYDHATQVGVLSNNSAMQH